MEREVDFHQKDIRVQHKIDSDNNIVVVYKDDYILDGTQFSNNVVAKDGAIVKKISVFFRNLKVRMYTKYIWRMLVLI